MALSPPPLTAEYFAKHVLFTPPPITLPSPTLSALGALVGPGDGLLLVLLVALGLSLVRIEGT